MTHKGCPPWKCTHAAMPVHKSSAGCVLSVSGFTCEYTAKTCKMGLPWSRTQAVATRPDSSALESASKCVGTSSRPWVARIPTPPIGLPCAFKGAGARCELQPCSLTFLSKASAECSATKCSDTANRLMPSVLNSTISSQCLGRELTLIPANEMILGFSGWACSHASQSFALASRHASCAAVCPAPLKVYAPHSNSCHVMELNEDDGHLTL
eukprot:6281710-Amphidinium_carterae.2